MLSSITGGAGITGGDKKIMQADAENTTQDSKSRNINHLGCEHEQTDLFLMHLNWTSLPRGIDGDNLGVGTETTCNNT